MIKLTNVSIPLQYTEKTLEEAVVAKLAIDPARILKIEIAERGVDVRQKNEVHFKMDLLVTVTGDENWLIPRNKKKGIFKEDEPVAYHINHGRLNNRPIVIGAGPAGLFAALILAESGANPILIEGGADVDQRKKAVQHFWKTGILNTQTNVQFGEGGAGTFSDGKLKVGKKDPRKVKVLKTLIESGAPSEIMYLAMPHIGTDLLHGTVKTIRQKIIALGGEVHFNTQMTRLLIAGGKVTGVEVTTGDFSAGGLKKTYETDHVVLAIGHSARDTFEMLYDSGVPMEQKTIAVGVRIEHPQGLIDHLKFGKFAGHPALGAADYKMVVHLESGRAVYTFCMCPGGTVVAATSEAGHVVTNGMSVFARNGRNANTALLVTIHPEDYPTTGALAGIAYQREIEKKAFIAGGSNYNAPVQRLEDFMNKCETKSFGMVTPTYTPGTTFAQVDNYMPEYVAQALREAIVEMEAWMPGFAHPDALLTGAETRSAAPVRLLRTEKCESVGIKGLYPCGEGAGYAGGIISAAIDGITCAEHILGKEANQNDKCNA